MDEPSKFYKQSFLGESMKKYLENYRKEIDLKLKKQKSFTTKEIENHLIKIQFFQHERAIHLFVTLFYGLFTLLAFLFGLIHPLLLIIPFLLMIFLLFYIFHYFFLENTVQYLYKQYDQMKEKEKSTNTK